jgi:hypothetical protein
MATKQAWRTLLEGAEPASGALRQAMLDPRRAQLDLLGRIVAANEECQFGRRHDFSRIDGIETYRQRVGVEAYEGVASCITRIAEGEQNLLTRAPIVAFEETGGSTSGRKLIPYTAMGLSAFRLAVLPWLAELARAIPAITEGRAYVAISPATRPQRMTPAGISVGLASDAAYLGADLAPAFAALLAVSPGTGQIADVEEWRIATLAELVAAPDLSFASVWSPTFLLDHIQALPLLADQVAARLNGADARRLDTALRHGSIDTARLWPQLACISCWTDGASAAFAARLAEVFPHARVEPKGLLATEAAISLPLAGSNGAIPALTSTVIEFVDEAGAVGLCDELSPGGLYRVVLTTWSGLYRYDIGDVVRCTATEGGLPRLCFEGRSGRVSDLVGEKLDDAFVARALSGLGQPAALVPRAAPQPHYELWLETEVSCTSAAELIDEALRGNPQYDYARTIGQLGPIRPLHRSDLAAKFLAQTLATGGRVGDTKAVGLFSEGGGLRQ